MGRRALPKINPNLDLDSYLLTSEKIGACFDPKSYFPVDNGLEVEVGSGKGLFLATAASETPDKNFLGIELRAAYARHIAARLAKRSLPNAKILNADAEKFFSDQLSDNCVSAVHVYFPDPWWKKRHHKRRIMNARFLKDVTRKLQMHGRLHFWTDVDEYFRLSLELIANEVPWLAGPLAVDERPPEHEWDYRTHFERRTRLQGQAVYRAEFEKTVEVPPSTDEPDSLVA